MEEGQEPFGQGPWYALLPHNVALPWVDMYLIL
jgi:hypothetical protein